MHVHPCAAQGHEICADEYFWWIPIQFDKPILCESSTFTIRQLFSDSFELMLRVPDG